MIEAESFEAMISRLFCLSVIKIITREDSNTCIKKIVNISFEEKVESSANSHGSEMQEEGGRERGGERDSRREKDKE